MRQSLSRKTKVFAVVGICLMIAGVVTAQMMEPKMTTIKGSIVDLTCASKGHATMGKWMNAKDDHMTPEGAKKGCGTMCLKGSQPAGLFDGKTVTAVFACNPAATLSAYSAKQVEVQGFWSGDDTLKSFVPAKIREGSGAWKEVQCTTMH